jgi:hypothetical protein
MDMGDGVINQTSVRTVPGTGASIVIKSVFPAARSSESITNAFFPGIVPYLKLDSPLLLRVDGIQRPSTKTGWAVQGHFCSRDKVPTSLESIFALGSVPDIFTPTTVCMLIGRIAIAMRDLHARDLFHGHLNPRNVLFDDDGNWRVCDFVSKFFVDYDFYLEHCSEVARYVAPELFDHKGFKEVDSQKIDVFSFGVILYDLVVFMEGFHCGSFVHSSLVIPDSIDPAAVSLIRRCCDVDPVARPSFVDILQDLVRIQFALLKGADCAAVCQHCTLLLVSGSRTS